MLTTRLKPLIDRVITHGDIGAAQPHAAGMLFGFGALLVSITLVIPGRDRVWLAIPAVALSAMVSFGYLRFAARVTPSVLYVTTWLSPLLIGVVVATNTVPSGADASLFVWVVMWSGFFFGYLHAFALTAWVGLVYAFVPSVMGGHSGMHSQHVLMLVGVVGMTGAWTGLLRQLVDWMLEHQAWLARTDPLTGLANRRELARAGEALVTEARQRGRRVALIVFNINDFAVFNDVRGHERADAVLISLAHRLVGWVERGMIPARLGGDEFAVLCTDCDESQVRGLVRNLLALLGEPVGFDTERLSVSVRAGWVVTDGRSGVEEMIRDADLAMQAARESGVGSAPFERRLREDVQQRRELVLDLHNAARNGELELHYQPIVGLQDERCSVVEALVRWRHPRMGLIPPDRFIGLAEQSGDILSVGAWVLREAVTQAATWPLVDGRRVVVSINLSPRQLADDSFVEYVVGTVDQAGLTPADVMLEVTETAVMAEPHLAIQRLAELRAHGFLVAIDDFGTGYSSLAYLRDLPATELKLAREFMRELPDGGPAEVMAGTIIGMAHKLGLRVVAEGIEEACQVDYLRNVGADLAQGYHYCRPMPVGERLLDKLTEVPSTH